ncbi:MAG: glycosyltransferase [Desulfocapsaceae bacterium]|nr:glycosyltransferase [Desulfosporosinus sp.]MDR3629539.1 glycosyltransferase [Desulfocapsaceae bacterium]
MKILVFTTVFPNEKQPTLGVFVRERMFKVARHCEVKVVAPVPWFPFIELIRPGYRPKVPYLEIQDGIEVYHPRFFNIPGVCKFLDGFFLFLSSFWTVRSLRKIFGFDIIDSHFIYPDAVGACWLSRVFNRPLTVTLRESNPGKFIRSPLAKVQVLRALGRATRVFSVCTALKDYFQVLKIDPGKMHVVPNGVDIDKFRQAEKRTARRLLGLPESARILITVGWLIERKGFDRVISLLPELATEIDSLYYVMVGAAPGDGTSYERRLRLLVQELKLENRVLFAGGQPHGEMYRWLCAADVFVLPTTGEGWANVFLEAMACGLPVVTSRVGGNSEVVCSDDYGILFDLENAHDLLQAIRAALTKTWDHEKIVAYAQENTWEKRVAALVGHFETIMQAGGEEKNEYS